MFDIDVRLLLLFQAIYQQNTISKAAQKLDIGQPAASLGLNKLRQHFDDPLFVRVGNQMQPTQTAQNLFPLVNNALQHIRAVNDYTHHFEPKNSSRRFHISMTDISHMIIVPKLIKYLKQHAPHTKLDISAINSDTPSRMSSGEIDLAIGYIPHLEAGFFQQTFFEQHYSVVVRQDHPRLTQNTLTLEAYQQEQHADVISSGTGHYLLEDHLRRRHIKRHIAITLPTYLGVGLIIQQTDLVATLPDKLAKLLLQENRLHTLPLPLDIPKYQVKQHWHERMHANPDNQWLRQVCYALFHQDNDS
ncbi:LysR family transcriptional regulator [Psychrobacter sp. YP14]|uniref:LysR family transcriptional regulator n=3 Tax=Psychrobacter TaxID=497 RepID=A0A844M068_9GAMM|nr:MULTISPECIES: LysR family transcriptional regulator [Psychrobacter]AWT48718.1 LysR family transcriptional regulator [Psychrobacter sp. YP14]MUG32070.1 LysR family transcriptional regulator [Psychrobacter sanguinis]